ncbi:hypothetical protein GCM10027418_19240 [Mariniluteicoccus endophyticus]
MTTRPLEWLRRLVDAPCAACGLALTPGTRDPHCGCETPRPPWPTARTTAKGNPAKVVAVSTVYAVAGVVARYANGRTGEFFLSYATAGRRVDVSPEVAGRALGSLVDGGWLEVVARGRGRGAATPQATKYRLSIPRQGGVDAGQTSDRQGGTGVGQTPGDQVGTGAGQTGTSTWQSDPVNMAIDRRQGGTSANPREELQEIHHQGGAHARAAGVGLVRDAQHSARGGE